MLTDEQFRQIMGSPQVRAQVQARATKIAARARSITQAEGGKAVISLESGTRANGRAYTNVVSSSAAEEHGTSGTRRRRALRRAALGG